MWKITISSPIPQAQAAGPSPYLRAYGDEDQVEGAVLAQWKKMQCLGAVVTNGGAGLRLLWYPLVKT